jgi:hypothetical protein
MLNKLSGLARTLYIIIAIVAAFVAMAGVNVALVLLVLGLIAGITTPRDRLVLAMAAVIALPLIGTALTNIPAIGQQLGAVMGNLQIAIAGVATTVLALMLYELAMAGVTGLTGSGSGSATRATA